MGLSASLFDSYEQSCYDVTVVTQLIWRKSIYLLAGLQVGPIKKC